MESLDASDDLKTWTLKLREGPTFNTPTPRPLDAEDVVFNLKRWLDPQVGSSMTGLLGAYLEASGIEKVDDRTIVLHLKAPTNTLPYDLYHYAGAVVPKEFEGDFNKQPWGTGPFELVEYVPNQSFTLKARKDYWQKGVDGQPLPYLESVVSYDVKQQDRQPRRGLPAASSISRSASTSPPSARFSRSRTSFSRGSRARARSSSACAPT